MDFNFGGHSDELRDEARAFVADQVTAELEERVYRTGVSYDPEFTAALVEEGWLSATWPEEIGGKGWTPLEYLAFDEELSAVHAPRYATGTTMGVARVIARVGSDELKQEIVPKAMRGEVIIALGFSEPESGSDVAAAQTRAIRDGDQWVIRGQKMFTTNAHIADYVFLLARTNPDVPKHKGLTMFLVPTSKDGFAAQAVYTVSGERTNITFYNDVRIDDMFRVGGVDQGWSVIRYSLQDEHSAGFGTRIAKLLEYSEDWARATTDENGRRHIDDPDVRRRLARVAADAEVSLLLQRRAVWMDEQDIVPEAEGPMSKLFSSEAMERCSQDMVELLGPDGIRSYFEPSAPEGGRIEHAMRFSLGTTIYAGTSEVQRNIIAQRGLGLPR
jgi:alkylation response protein AidB-like acyl-CoA dehydrogenase